MLPFSSYKGTPSGQETLCELIVFDASKVNLFAASVAACPPHWHESPELIVVLEGAYAINIDDHSCNIVAPGLVFINKDQVHALKAFVSPSSLLTIQFGSGLFDEHHKPPVCGLNSSDHAYTQAIPSVVEAVHALVAEQLRAPNSFAVLACIYHLLSLIAALDRNLAPTASTAGCGSCEAVSTASPKYDNLRLAIDYINRNYEKDLKLDEVAAIAHMSYFHFSRVFKQLCQRSFKEYLMLIRVNHAKTLLRDTSIHITDIAARCGFNDHKQFISACKKVFGVTPTEFRKLSTLQLRELHEQMQAAIDDASTTAVTVIELEQAQKTLERAFAL